MSGDGSTFLTTTCEMTVDEDGITADSTPTTYLEGQAARFSAWVASLSEGSARDRGNLVLSTLDDGLSMGLPTNPLSRRVSGNRLVVGTVLSMAFYWIQYDGSTGGLVAFAFSALAAVTALYTTTKIEREHVESVEIDEADRELTITHETIPGILNFLGYDETESTWRLPDDESVEEARRAFEEYDGAVETERDVGDPSASVDLTGIERELGEDHRGQQIRDTLEQSEGDGHDADDLETEIEHGGVSRE